jgi:hypothetical protein
MPTRVMTLEGAEMAYPTIDTAMTLNSKSDEMTTHATVLEDMVVSLITTNLKCEEMPTHTTTPESVEMVSPMTLYSKGEERESVENLEMVSPIPMIASTMEAVSPMTL